MDIKNTDQETNVEVFVAGHICLDMLPTFDEKSNLSLSEIFVPGKLNHIGKSVFSSGGTVSNTGFALRQLGFRTGLMAKIGDDLFGQGLLKILEDFREGLQLIIDPSSSTSYSYVIAPPGIDRTFLHHPGANDSFTSRDLNYDRIAQARLFHFGYPPLMKKMYEQNGEDLIQIFKKVKANNVTTSLDMAYPDPESDSGRANWQQIMVNTLPYVDVFLPSIEELLYMIDRDEFGKLVKQSKATGQGFIDLFDMNKLPILADNLIDMGVAVCVIKLGHKGLFMKTASKSRLAKAGKSFDNLLDWEDSAWFAPSFFVEKIESTTGAGDAAIAGILSGILASKHSWQALQLGCASAAQKIQVRKSFGGIDPLNLLMDKLTSWGHEKVDNIPVTWQFDSEKRIWQI